MPVAELGDREPVVASVLRAVGERRAVRADRGGHEPAPPVTGHLVPGLPRERDAAVQQRHHLTSVEAAFGEAGEGRLVARGGGDDRSRLEERAVRRDDLAGRVEQQPRRPQRVGEVVSPGLQLGGQPAVAHHESTVERSHGPHCRSADPNAAVSAGCERVSAGYERVSAVGVRGSAEPEVQPQRVRNPFIPCG